MDITRFTVYCGHCQDYVHDRELEGLVKEEKITAREVQIQASGKGITLFHRHRHQRH